MIPWYRSFPAHIPEGRSYVVDDMPRLICDTAGTGASTHDLFDADLPDEDFIMVEWDIAVSYEARIRFPEDCLAYPDRVQVVPYRMYPASGTGLDYPVWCMSKKVPQPPGYRWLKWGEKECDYFGFGCIYFPRDVVRQFRKFPLPSPDESWWPNPAVAVAQGWHDTLPARRFYDIRFSRWYSEQCGPALVNWSVRELGVIHLHY